VVRQQALSALSNKSASNQAELNSRVVGAVVEQLTKQLSQNQIQLPTKE